MIKTFIRKILGVKDQRDPTEPVILGPDEHGIDPRSVSSNAIRVTQALQEAGYQAFVVGGCVRDSLLDMTPKEFDVATSATPEQACGHQDPDKEGPRMHLYLWLQETGQTCR